MNTAGAVCEIGGVLLQGPAAKLSYRNAGGNCMTGGNCMPLEESHGEEFRVAGETVWRWHRHC